MARKQRRKKTNPIVVLVLLAVLAVAMGWIPLGPAPATIPGVPAAPGVPGLPVCGVEDTTINLAPQDTFARGSNVDIQVDYWIGGEYVGKNYSTSDTDELIASPGDGIVTVAMANANGTVDPKVGGTGIGGDLVYYGAKNTYTVPCSGTYIDNLYVYKADQEIEDFMNASASQGSKGYVIEDLSITVFNADDQVNSDGSNEFSIGEGVYDFQIKVKVTSDQYFSNPESSKGILICFDADAVNSGTLAEIDEIKITNLGARAVSVPKAFLGTFDWCWELRQVTHLKDGETIYIDGTIDADDSDGPDAEDHIGFWLIDTNYYKDTDTGELFGPDYEDNDGAQVGLYNNVSSGEGGTNASIVGEHVLYVSD